MTRISLKEQYDNSSVVKQIVDLSDKVDETAETAETAKTTASEAGVKADVAKATADTATAKNTEQDAAIAALQTKDTEQDAAIAAVKTTADAAVADVTINTDEISATLLLKNSVESETSKAIPLASENATGMMTKATYSGMVALGDRVNALEGKTTVVYVSFTSDDPSQSEITNLFTAQTGKTPIAGNQAVDIERSLTYQYNGSEWLKTTQQVAEWTNTTPGVVKGTPAGTENAGTIFAESDGTGSVNGWDDLVARVATNESAIGTTIPTTYVTKNEAESVKTALAETTSTANDAQNKVNGCVDSVALSEDGKTLIFTKVDDTQINIDLPIRFEEVTGKFFFDLSELNGDWSYSLSDHVVYTDPVATPKGLVINKKIFLAYECTAISTTLTGGHMGRPYVTKYPTMITKMINQIISKFDPLDGSYCFQLFRTDEIGASSPYSVYLLFEIADGEITAYNLSYTKSFDKTTAAFLVCDSDGNYGANAEFWVSFISFE